MHLGNEKQKIEKMKMYDFNLQVVHIYIIYDVYIYPYLYFISFYGQWRYFKF